MTYLQNSVSIPGSSAKQNKNQSWDTEQISEYG